MITRQKLDGGFAIEAQRARVLPDAELPQLIEIYVPGQDNLVLGIHVRVVVERLVVSVGGRILEGHVAKVEETLLERHETGGCEKSRPENDSFVTFFFLFSCKILEN